MSNSKTAIVTGAAGFIGSHLCERLLRDGWFVYGVDDMSSGSPSNIENLRKFGKFIFSKYNIAGPMTWLHGSEASKWDVIFHFASPASPPDFLRRPLSTIDANVTGTRHLLELCRKYGKTFFFASTSEIYGDPLVHPQPESYTGNVDPTGPRSVYDEAKRMGETLVTTYQREYNLDTRIVRIFNTYGPQMRPDDGRVVTNFIVQALAGNPFTIYGDGQQTRSLCYVSDLIDGIMLILEKGDTKPYNLGNPYEITVENLASLISHLTESEFLTIYKELPQDDPKVRCPDISRIRDLGWEPKVRTDLGLTRTIEYLKQLMVEGVVLTDRLHDNF